MGLLQVILLSAAAQAEVAPVDIKLDRCSLHWDESSGLSAAYDGRTVLGGSTNPVVVYPPGWAWSYGAWKPEAMTVTVETQANRTILRIQCPDEKVPWTEVVSAGPGDRFTLEYTYRQEGWDQPMMSEVCLFRPTVGWFVGAEFRATGDGGETTGRVPLQFEGTTNPFAGVRRAEFTTLFGSLAVEATRPVTLYDYAHRQNLWLGRDEPFPRGEEQSWSAEFVFESKPFVVEGVRIEQVTAPDTVVGKPLEVRLALARENDGPERITARLVVATGEAGQGTDRPTSHEREVALGAEPAALALTVPLPEAGEYACHLELLADGEPIYESPPMFVRVPRLLTALPGRAPYTNEANGEVLVNVDEQAGDDLRLVVQGPGGELHAGRAEAGRRITAPIALDQLPMGRSEIVASLYRGDNQIATDRCELLRAEPREHVVAVDNRGRGLIVDGLPFVPASFYTVYPGAPVDEEAPLGFNLIAPYLPGDIEQRRAMREDLRQFLDRCAAVGLYVHLDIRSAATLPDSEEKWAWVQEEVKAFRDHPALLCWYLADEPELGSASPEACAEAYRRIKEWDPYHPITMVFCNSAAAANYADGMDVVMTDPYPLPHGSVTAVRDFCTRIRSDISDTLPLWVVPQAFGGGEWWRREPSRQEERVMTYLALVHGAKGIQPFIRRPPIGNPTSPDLWSECRRLALEISQLAPALASGEETPDVTCSATPVDVAAFKERGAMTVLAVNVENRPLPIDLALDATFDGTAEVLFENRAVEVSQGNWSDVIDAFGTRAYRIQLQPPPADRVELDPGNLIVNPSFEESHNVGTPDGSYLGVGEDPSASWFVDPRLSVHGRCSLRLTTPAEGQGVHISPFPIPLEPGKRYRLCVWARGDREGLHFSLTLDAVTAEQGTHTLTTDWQEYAVEFTASENAGARSGAGLRLISAGKAWFDALQVVPLP